MADDPHSPQGKNLDQLLDMMAVSAPGSGQHERAKEAVAVYVAKSTDAANRRAGIAVLAAIVSAGGAVASAIAAFIR